LEKTTSVPARTGTRQCGTSSRKPCRRMAGSRRVYELAGAVQLKASPRKPCQRMAGSRRVYELAGAVQLKAWPRKPRLQRRRHRQHSCLPTLAGQRAAPRPRSSEYSL
jgi:hypothetical protein